MQKSFATSVSMLWCEVILEVCAIIKKIVNTSEILQISTIKSTENSWPSMGIRINIPYKRTTALSTVMWINPCISQMIDPSHSQGHLSTKLKIARLNLLRRQCLWVIWHCIPLKYDRSLWQGFPMYDQLIENGRKLTVLFRSSPKCTKTSFYLLIVNPGKRRWKSCIRNLKKL